MGKGKDITFEESYRKLEKIVEDLERGDLSLDDSLKRFQEGMNYLQICRKHLDDATNKVEILLKGEGSELYTKPFAIDQSEEDWEDVEY